MVPAHSVSTTRTLWMPMSLDQESRAWDGITSAYSEVRLIHRYYGGTVELRRHLVGADVGVSQAASIPARHTPVFPVLI